jgi:hypothetical protein
MPGLLRQRLVATTTALVLAACVAACSDNPANEAAESSPSESVGEPTPTPSPSPTTTPSPEPEQPEPPAAKDTAAGREAFAEFVIDSWSFALATNDATAVTDLSPKARPCQGCADFATELHKREKQGWYVDFPGVNVVKLKLAPGDLPGVQVATATMNVPASTSYFEDGAVRNENRGRRGATFEVRMQLDGKRFSLLAFSVG